MNQFVENARCSGRCGPVSVTYVPKAAPSKKAVNNTGSNMPLESSHAKAAADRHSARQAAPAATRAADSDASRAGQAAEDRPESKAQETQRTIADARFAPHQSFHCVFHLRHGDVSADDCAAGISRKFSRTDMAPQSGGAPCVREHRPVGVHSDGDRRRRLRDVSAWSWVAA